jgi:putative FmdB family regulatory protein
MPTYEYLCNRGHKFERVQGITDPKIERCLCPGCGARAKRLISSTSFILKGSGWAKDGYSSGSKKSKQKGGTKDGKRDHPRRTPRPPE